MGVKKNILTMRSEGSSLVISKIRETNEKNLLDENVSSYLSFISFSRFSLAIESISLILFSWLTFVADGS